MNYILISNAYLLLLSYSQGEDSCVDCQPSTPTVKIQHSYNPGKYNIEAVSCFLIILYYGITVMLYIEYYI